MYFYLISFSVMCNNILLQKWYKNAQISRDWDYLGVPFAIYGGIYGGWGPPMTFVGGTLQNLTRIFWRGTENDDSPKGKWANYIICIPIYKWFWKVSIFKYFALFIPIRILLQPLQMRCSKCQSCYDSWNNIQQN